MSSLFQSLFEIEIIRAKASEARIAGARDAVSRRGDGWRVHLGDQECAVALTKPSAFNKARSMILVRMRLPVAAKIA